MWTEYRREFVLDRWEHEDQPSSNQKRAVYDAIMELREEPRRPEFAVRIPDLVPETWVADVPRSDPLVCILYTIYDDQHAIDYLMIESPD